MAVALRDCKYYVTLHITILRRVPAPLRSFVRQKRAVIYEPRDVQLSFLPFPIQNPARLKKVSRFYFLDLRGVGIGKREFGKLGEAGKSGNWKLESPRKWEMLDLKVGKLWNEEQRNERIGKWKMGNIGIEGGKIRERRTKKRKNRNW